MKDKLFGVGKLGSTRGVKGEMKYHSMDDLSFLEGEKIILRSVDIYTLYEVEKAGDYIKIKGIDNPEDAKKLTGSVIYIAKDNLDKYEMLKSEIIGMEVVNRGVVLGVVKGMMQTPAYDQLDIKGKVEYSIPFIDKFIGEIVREKRIIKTDLAPEDFQSS